MEAYKHYSFDCWLTIIRSNPSYSNERAKYFFEKYNPFELPFEEVKNIIKDVQKMCDFSNENSMQCISSQQMIGMILYRLGNKTFVSTMIVEVELDDIFWKYPPMPYSKDTIPTLKKLRSLGVTTTILCNTGFIRGSLLREWFKRNELGKLFDALYFSDEYNLSKPSTGFYNEMINDCIKNTCIEEAEIVHIGDNEWTDGDGASNAGINAYIINSNDLTIKDILPSEITV